MGNWYANISLRGVHQEEVIHALQEQRRTAFVSKESHGHVVVYDSLCRRMDGDDSERLAESLTRSLGCLGMIALNADDDVLWLCVYESGTRVGEYDSSSGSRAGAAMLARAYGKPLLTPWLWMVLQGPAVFAVWRHIRVCSALGLPAKLCIHGYPGDDDGRLAHGVRRHLFKPAHRA